MTAKTTFKLFLKIPKIEKKVKKNLIRQMNKVVLFLIGFTKDSMTISNEKGKNPSKEGDVPNVGKGAAGLKGSITGAVVESQGDIVGIFGVLKGAASKYAARLEYGFIGTDAFGRNINQKPRPFLAPAYENNKKKIKAALLELGD